MALQHDNEGFLTGETIRDIRRANELLQSIKSDISAIKRAIMERPDGTGDGSSAGPSTQNQAAGNTQTGNNAANVNVNVDVNVDGGPAPAGERNETTPPHIDNRSVRADDPGATTRSSSRRRGRQGRADNAAEPRPRGERGGPPIAGDTGTASPRNQNRARARDASGRFASENSGPTEPAAEPNARRDSRGRFSSNGEGDTQSQRTFLNGVTDRIATAIADSGAGLEEADPTVKAFKEVAEPMTKGYQILFGGEKEDERWYRKIFKELRLFRREDTAYNRAARRSLRNMEEQHNGGNEGQQSFWGGFTGSILPRLLAVLYGIGPMLRLGVQFAFEGVGLILRTVLMGVFSPIGLAISAAAAVAWGLFTESGRKFFADVGVHISDAWDGAVEWFKSTFPGIIETFTELAEDIAELWQPIADFFKDKFGIVQKGVNAVKDSVSEVVNGIVSGYEKATEAAKGAKAWTVDKATQVKDWVLGQTSKFFESGNRGAGAISTGKGDHGGASYGTYQLSSKKGTLQEFLKSTPFGKQFEGLAPGTSEFNKKWKSVAKSEPDFESAQHDFIRKTHFEPQMEKLLNAGMDLSGRGSAVKDAVWSTAVQFGGNTSLIKNALQGKDVSKLSDSDIIKLIQDYKITHNERLFESSSSNTRHGTLNRAKAEKEKLLSLAALEESLQNAIVQGSQSYSDSPIRTGEPSLRSLATASAPSPGVSPMPKTASFSDAPPLVVPMGSDASKKGITVTVERGDIPQDLSDRKIALVATGGLSG